MNVMREDGHRFVSGGILGTKMKKKNYFVTKRTMMNGMQEGRSSFCVRRILGPKI